MILRIAVPVPLRRSFDYLPPNNASILRLRPGMRVLVPFGRRRLIGVVLEIVTTSQIATDRLRRVINVIDIEPVLTALDFALLCWSSQYYLHPIGEVIMAALPRRLRQGKALYGTPPMRWRITEAGRSVNLTTHKRAHRQAQVLSLLRGCFDGLDAGQLMTTSAVLKTLQKNGWIETVAGTPTPNCSPVPQMVREAPPAVMFAAELNAVKLNLEQQRVVAAVCQEWGQFGCVLVDGVTGSGKTEVYLQLVQYALKNGKQSLLLVPEIGLTPQFLARFSRRLALPIAVLHSGLTDLERLHAWRGAASGEVRVIIGTRSAVFVSLLEPGLFIVDEEHDLSYKQHDGFRYSARDVIIKRAQLLGVPVVLGSATPSIESLHNVATGRYRCLQLTQRAGTSSLPEVALLDIRYKPLTDGLSALLLKKMAQVLAGGDQVLVFLNRRGFAPIVICHGCGWLAECSHCDARLTWHRDDNILRCHHCAREWPLPTACPKCSHQPLTPAGIGTERVETALEGYFPDAAIVRIDRDSTRGKGELEKRLGQVHAGEAQILIGTQMLAKGHHFPGVTLVAILNADQGLFGSDFRANERMAQLIVQVTGRAGRAEKPGTVLIQTHNPHHPMWQHMLNHDYRQFAEVVLNERREAFLPPFSAHALLRAEAKKPGQALQLLQQLKTDMEISLPSGVDCLGPVPALMERRIGYFRAQLLFQAERRSVLHRLLCVVVTLIEEKKKAHSVRWWLDVDPQEVV